MKLLYLCGQIAGRLYKKDEDHFSKIKNKLYNSISNNGLEITVIDPMAAMAWGIGWNKLTRNCISTMMTCDGIALMKGWGNCKTARIELMLAKELNIPVVFIEPDEKYDYLSELFTLAPESLRYFNARLTQFHNEGVEQSLAENRAEAELVNRYLDPYGFEYIEISREE